MKKILVVVDMQKDFVDGALGSKEAAAIVPAVYDIIRSFDGDDIFVTYDTHYSNYSETLEGQKLPVPHCIEGTPGHELDEHVRFALEGKEYTEIIKKTFGTFEIGEILRNRYPGEEIEAEFVGLCTDICVVSNILILRAFYPNSIIKVHAGACAGVSPETHQAALATMRCCQIDVID